MPGTRSSAAEIMRAIEEKGAITEPTLAKLLDLLERKTDYKVHVAVEILTKSILKTVDNEEDALETIRRLEGAPDKKE
jgi:hypothetical protein